MFCHNLRFVYSLILMLKNSCGINVSIISSIFSSSFFSFREAIADFLNYYMKPVEPILAQHVSIITFDTLITIALDLEQYIVSQFSMIQFFPFSEIYLLICSSS